jgi:hypothetical protein
MVATRSEYCVVVGDIHSTLAEFARSLDPNAYLVTDKDLERSHTGTIYTSLGDFKHTKDFFNLLIGANRIILHPPETIWSDGCSNHDRYSLAWHTDHFCKAASRQHSIPLKTPYTDIVDLDRPASRLDHTPHVWIAGCSTTYGSGVDPHEVYWHDIVSHLNMPHVVLAKPGTSISWSADQILRADIRQGDMIIWGITNSFRFYWYRSHGSIAVNPAYYDMHSEFASEVPESVLVNDHWAYESIIASQRVKNMCDKLQVQLLLVGIHADIDFSAQWADHSSFLMIHGTNGLDRDCSFLDYGTDNLHPGPLTHKMYSSKIKQHLNRYPIILSKKEIS